MRAAEPKKLVPYSVAGMSQATTPSHKPCKGSSKVSLRLATLRGVLAVASDTGVFHGFCAGLGVMLTKSAKSKGWPGVAGNRLPPPGVVIIDDGRASFFCGGVDGGSMVRNLLDLTAGDGDAARYSNRSAPSSPDLVALGPALASGRRPSRPRLRIGGVLGGDDRMWLWSTWKECAGKRSSSSSELEAKLGEARSSAGRRNPSKNETSGPVEVVKCCCLRGLIGDDWMSCLWARQEALLVLKDLCAVGDDRRRLVGLDMAMSNEAVL